MGHPWRHEAIIGCNVEAIGGKAFCNVTVVGAVAGRIGGSFATALSWWGILRKKPKWIK
jgi:hypothetical protein